MAELTPIVTLTTISSTRANEWQARLIQRYSSVANRTTEHPSPSEGDLAYLEDSNTVWVYDGSSWLLLGPNLEVDGSTEVAGPVTMTGAGATVATVNLTIPTTWGGWKCEAYATMQIVGAGSTTSIAVRIDGTDQQFQPMPSFYAGSASVGGRRTGLTTTGSRAILLRAINTAGGSVSTAYLYARAVRTS